MSGKPMKYRRVSVKGWEPGMGTSPVVSGLEKRVKELERQLAEAQRENKHITKECGKLRWQDAVVLEEAEAREAKLREALRRLSTVPAVLMALGYKHTPDCTCPLCAARILIASSPQEERHHRCGKRAGTCWCDLAASPEPAAPEEKP